MNEKLFNYDSRSLYDVFLSHCFPVVFLLLTHWCLITAGKDGIFDYISVTPPYTLVDYAELMDQISNSSVVGENTFMVS